MRFQIDKFRLPPRNEVDLIITDLLSILGLEFQHLAKDRCIEIKPSFLAKKIILCYKHILFLSTFQRHYKGFPSKFDKKDLETWLKKHVSFICSVTMFNTILFYASHICQITCNFST